MSGAEVVGYLAIYLATGAFAGILAGLLGVGGGVIIVPVLIFVFSHQGFAPEWVPHLAVGTSLATILGTGSASVRAHHRRGAVRWGLVRALAPGIVVGAWLGAAIAGVLPEQWLTRIFALFLLFVGVRMLHRRAASTRGQLPGGAGLLAAGAGIGTLSALVGIGGGTLTVPFLNRSGVELRAAVATSSACGVPLALAGAIGFAVVGWGRAGLPPASTGFVYWPAVAAMLLASVPAAPVGAHFAHTLPVDLVKRIFAVLVILVGLRLLG
ncbi:putative permease [Thioflavicoccus mobilis 8321]|uniref:Probable membrane transporter protein n=1 Tax=Thioflavicoccus mobilis 8321 TaxID=765912 RepID=L0GVT2_9GAMM|nr:sulfite exporter TauE/SafE family protein [Thioflavicoccus mobilis]AGA89414.1 putative permease [Thioflavicoccus mobilis 8321]